jgi:Mor family transcriptional regulator
MQNGRMEEKRHKLLEDVMDTTAALLRELGLQDEAADLIAAQTADMLANHWGGQNIYIPTEYLRKLTSRELEIYHQFTGQNYDLLAAKFGMSERGMRKLLHRVRDRLRRQARGLPDLFEAA